MNEISNLAASSIRQRPGLLSLNVDDVAKIEVGPGCFRRDLPGTGDVRVWVVDMEPGAEWPYIDHHDDKGEEVFVVSGEVIEDGQRFGPGSYLFYGPGSSHRPRTDTGVRLFGFNLIEGGA